MPQSPSHQLDVLAREIFELTKITWLTAQRTKLDGQHDLSESEFLALDALEQIGSVTVGDLQRRINVQPAQMSRIIKSLETKYDSPLVTCTINREDKRKINVRLSGAGTDAASAFRRGKISINAGALRSLSAEDVDDLMRLVRIIRKTMAS